MSVHFMGVEPIRHRLGLAGRVRDGNSKQPLVGVEVTIEDAPESFGETLARMRIRYGANWNALRMRADRQRTAGDGSFRFLELPAGSYTLKIEAPGGGYQPATVTTRVAGDDQSPAPILDIPLNPG